MRSPTLAAAVGRWRERCQVPGLIPIGGRSRRRVWRGRRSYHIEVRTARHPGSGALSRALEREIARLKGVDWAQVNAVTGRLVVALDPDADEERPDLGEIVDVVDSVEELHGAAGARFSHLAPEFPGDAEPLRRAAIALCGDVIGLPIATFGLVSGITPVPAELAALAGVIENERRVHEVLRRHIGATASELGISLSAAAVHAMTAEPLNLVVDAIDRLTAIAELRSRRSLWERREPALTEAQRDVMLEPFDRSDRPVPLSKGRIERYSDRIALGTMAGFGLAMATTRDPRRSVDTFAAGIPKAARLTREAFSSQLGRELARRGVLVMDHRALRRLDRIDAVVFDMHVLEGPDSRPDPFTEILGDASRQCGLSVIGAGRRGPVSEALGADTVIAGGRRLRQGIRRLQSDGRGVLLVADGSGHDAMDAADVCLGIMSRDGQVPWGADLVGGTNLEDVWLLVQACASARDVARTGVLLSMAGSGIAGVWAFTGTSSGAARRASIPVNGAALLGQGAGTTSALRLGHLRSPLPPSVIPWHEMDVADVMAALATPGEGLDSGEAAKRAEDQPASGLPSLASRFARAVLAEVANPLTPILGLGVGLSAAVGSVADAALVGGVMVTNAVVGGVQRVRTEVSLDRLVRQSSATVGVRRAGSRVDVEPAGVVRGDLLELEAGDLVPADCRILETSGCEVDESSLTGESLPVSKQALAISGVGVSDRTCMLYEGSTVLSGSALAVAVATGRMTEAGRAVEAAPEPPPSGVEARLGHLTKTIVPATIASGAAVTGLSLLRSAGLRESVASGVSLMVAAVPEGLPVLATGAQLAAARRLSGRQALVRNPRSVEALGRVDMLCFDKTGTLTAGEIALRCVSDGILEDPVGNLGGSRRLVLAAALRASPESDGGPMLHGTDEAVLEGGEAAGVSSAEGAEGWVPLGELPFLPERGFHVVAGKCRTGSLIAVKGAPEAVLPMCSHWRTDSGVLPLTVRRSKAMVAEAGRLAEKGLRVLAVAEKQLGSGSSQARGLARRWAASSGGQRADGAAGSDLADMTLLGFVGMADRVRPSAAAAVRELRRAGVEVAMITGDHPATAATVAREIGIVNGKAVMLGADIDALSDGELEGAIGSVSVFARVTPAQKVRIVGALQRSGHVVAMTGDGANDAAAIRLADAGIALGRRAAQATVSAADVVVTDDRIETIVDAIIEGRAMWASVRDALAILVGGNIGEIAFTVAGTAIGGRSPLGARQLLLVNLLTDMLPAMTIALRPPADRSPESLIHEGPDAALGGSLVSQVALRAVTTAAGATGAWLVARSTGSERRASTVGFAALVGTQLAQTAVIGVRSPLVLVSTGVAAAALVAAVQTPGVSQFFGCRPMGPVAWGIAAGAAGLATGASVVLPYVASSFNRLARDV